MQLKKYRKLPYNPLKIKCALGRIRNKNVTLWNKCLLPLVSLFPETASEGTQKSLNKEWNLKGISGLNYPHKQSCQFQDTEILIQWMTIHSLQMTSTHKIILGRVQEAQMSQKVT